MQKVVYHSGELINLLFICKSMDCFGWHISLIFLTLWCCDDICNIKYKQNCFRMSSSPARYLNGDFGDQHWQFIFSYLQNKSFSRICHHYMVWRCFINCLYNNLLTVREKFTNVKFNSVWLVRIVRKRKTCVKITLTHKFLTKSAKNA